MTHDAPEKEMVVPGHGSDVEGVCLYGVAGELDDQILAFLVLVRGACMCLSQSLHCKAPISSNSTANTMLSSNWAQEPYRL